MQQLAMTRVRCTTIIESSRSLCGSRREADWTGEMMDFPPRRSSLQSLVTSAATVCDAETITENERHPGPDVPRRPGAAKDNRCPIFGTGDTAAGADETDADHDHRSFTSRSRGRAVAIRWSSRLHRSSASRFSSVPPVGDPANAAVDAGKQAVDDGSSGGSRHVDSRSARSVSGTLLEVLCASRRANDGNST